MKIISLNMGKVTPKPWRDGVPSGICKQSVEHSVQLSNTGLEGDEQADLKNHGGEDKALLVLPTSAYLRFEIEHDYGFLGENLAINDLDEADVCLGDRFQIGTVLLEVSQPRSPCWKLDAQVSTRITKWQPGEFLKAYSDSGHVGFYCRVLTTGKLQKQQSVRWLTLSNEAAKKYPKISIKELYLAKSNPSSPKDWKRLKQAINHPALSLAWQTSINQLLDKHAAKHS
ncbi:MOSC domain-containing protein [Thiomicrorhabdus sp. Milos-T2]|uniref:MOSC domain-containing protein n=1 Tax=Thiomicrorhabdus sp. Milos-T2 TaxID=90814 RepID=UPI00068E1D8C|nr:MOSC domain-containing protein [Thiomicrorhabdus sp. Milos-T2]